MIYRDKRNLPIISTDKVEDYIGYEPIKAALRENISNTVYFVCRDKLYGIITSGDFGRAFRNGLSEVKINKNFVRVGSDDYMEALYIFKDKKAVNSIPVVDGNQLVGEYCRFDDILLLSASFYSPKKYYKKLVDNHIEINFLISDSNRKHKNGQSPLLSYLNYLESIDVDVNRVCTVNESVDKAPYAARFLVQDLNVKYPLCNYMELCGKISSLPYISTIGQIEDKLYWEEKINEIIATIKNRGVHIYYMDYRSKMHSKYRKLDEEILEKYKNTEMKPYQSDMVQPEMYREFYGEIFDIDMAESINSYSLKQEESGGISYLINQETAFLHVKNKERYTPGQPDNYDKSIFLFGPCFVAGVLTDDDHTISAYLQQIYNEQNKRIRVVNYGMGGSSPEPYFARILYHMENDIKPGDVVLFYGFDKDFEGIERISMGDAIINENPSPYWFSNSIIHHNHIVNEILAKEIVKKLDSVIDCYQQCNEPISPWNGYMKLSYLDRYFCEDDYLEKKERGAIVMNCNPFTKGHRYLIEQALSKCDELVIFVVNEDKSLFSFNSRMSMVLSGTKDLDRVRVVPSGGGILSSDTFPDYFEKVEKENTYSDALRDIEIFATKIAPYLNIKRRFVGEENNDSVTALYNLAMKEVLPKFGIELVEIPRKRDEGVEISATTVRKCIETRDYNRLKELVPQSTLDILFWEE